MSGVSVYFVGNIAFCMLPGQCAHILSASLLAWQQAMSVVYTHPKCLLMHLEGCMATWLGETAEAYQRWPKVT